MTFIYLTENGKTFKASKLRKIMSSLKLYSILEIKKFLEWLNQNLSKEKSLFPITKNIINFTAEPPEEIYHYNNTFNQGLENITINDKQLLEILPVLGIEDSIFSFGKEYEKANWPIAEAYFERGKINKTDTRNKACYYEYTRLEIPNEIMLKSGITIPVCTIKIQAEFIDSQNPTIERRDHIESLFFRRRSDLESIIPTDTFLANPKLKYKKNQKY